MAVLVIGIIAALLVALTLGFALLVEIRSVRSTIAHGNKTQHRIALIEGARYRSSKRTHGERAGRRADYEDRSSRYAKASLDKLEAIRALLVSFAAPERAESARDEGHHLGEPAPESTESDSDEGRLHSELAPERVAKAAKEIKDRRAVQRATAAASERGDVEQPATIGGEEDQDQDADRLTSKLPEEPGAVAAYVELATEPGAVAASTETEEELTTVWTTAEAARVRREAAAGGAARHPSATPRAALSVDVAPPASAPPSTSPEPAIRAAGLERPRSARPAPHAPPVRVRTETLAGMPSPLLAPATGETSERTSWPGLKQDGGVGLSTRTPAGSAPGIAVPRFAPTMASMPAQSAAPASSRAVPSVPTKEVCKRCERSGVIRDLGGAIVPCPRCNGYGLVDTSARPILPEAS